VFVVAMPKKSGACGMLAILLEHLDEVAAGAFEVKEQRTAKSLQYVALPALVKMMEEHCTYEEMEAESGTPREDLKELADKHRGRIRYLP